MRNKTSKLTEKEFESGSYENLKSYASKTPPYRNKVRGIFAIRVHISRLSKLPGTSTNFFDLRSTSTQHTTNHHASKESRPSRSGEYLPWPSGQRRCVVTISYLLGSCMTFRNPPTEYTHSLPMPQHAIISAFHHLAFVFNISDRFWQVKMSLG